MTYTNFNAVVQAVEGDTFVKENNFRDMLDELTALDFDYQTDRNSAKKVLAGLVKERYIFNRHTRFPTNHWVNIDEGDWPQMFANLRNALGFKIMGEIDEKESTSNHLLKSKDKSTMTSQQYQDFKDSMVSYNSIIANMASQIRRTVTYQLKFEDKYNLVWQAQNLIDHHKETDHKKHH